MDVVLHRWAAVAVIGAMGLVLSSGPAEARDSGAGTGIEAASVWVLDEIIEVRNDDRWAHKNELPGARYKYDYSAGRSVFSVTTTYVGPTQQQWTPPIIEGESITLSGRFSAPPARVVPGDELSVELELSAANNSLSGFEFHADARAEMFFLDGERRGGPIRLVGPDNVSNFQIRKDRGDYAPVSAVLTGVVPAGRGDERRLVVEQTFSRQVSMYIHYIYRWRDAGAAVPDADDLYPSPVAVVPRPAQVPGILPPDTLPPGLVDSGVGFSDLFGEVYIRPPDDPDDYYPADLGVVLPVGTIIETRDNSGAILSLRDMTTFVVRPNSRITIGGQSDDENKFYLLVGHVWVNIQQMARDGSMDIEMSQAMAGARGTTFVVSDDGTTSSVKVFEGAVEFAASATGETVVVSAGQTSDATAAGLRGPSVFDIEAELENWDDRVQAWTREAMSDMHNAGVAARELDDASLPRTQEVATKETDLPAELVALASQGRLTVRALRAWGQLPERFSQLALELHRHDVDLLAADQAVLEALIVRASDDPALSDRVGELEELSHLLADYSLPAAAASDHSTSVAEPVTDDTDIALPDEGRSLSLDLTPEISLSVTLPPGWEFEGRPAGVVTLSTEAASGRSIRIEALNAARHLDNRRLFADGARIETLRGTILGQEATFLRGATAMTHSPTIAMTWMQGTRLLALPDLCLPDGAPFTVTVISGADFSLPEDDPELTPMLEAITLRTGPDLQPCPPGMAVNMIARMGAADAVATAGEEGFKRVAALGLSVALPEEMNGEVSAHGLQFLNGPDRLSVRLARVRTDQGQLRPAALAEMTAAGSSDLGAAGVFDIYQRSQTGLWGRDYAVHETWVVGRDRHEVSSGGRSHDEVLHLVIRNEGDGLPDWETLAPVHARIVELLRAAEDES